MSVPDAATLVKRSAVGEISAVTAHVDALRRLSRFLVELTHSISVVIVVNSQSASSAQDDRHR